MKMYIAVNYDTIKKTQWQEIAKHYGVVFEEDSVVRYLVEKIAEKIGVDEKIVSDRELKRKVVEKINLDYEASEKVSSEKETWIVEPINEAEKIDEEPIVEEPISEEPVVEETVVEEPVVEEPVVEEPVVEEPVVEEPVVEEPIAEEPIAEEPVAEEPVVEEPKVELSRLEQLRLECESYGVAWAENHTETNLEQVLNGVKSAGVQPIKDVPTFSAPIEKELDVTQEFEINSDNVDDVSQLIQVNQRNNPAFNPFAVESKPIVNGGYNNSNTYLDTFKNIYLNAIKNHWRVLSYNEINEMISRDKNTFTFQINFHQSQSNKVEIILKQDNNSVRIPSEDLNEWLEING
jgi:hypothetical protein